MKMDIQLIDIIIGSTTLLVTVLSSYLSYRLGKQSIKLQHQTQRLNSLEKKYGIAIDNLNSLYAIEKEYFTKALSKSHKQIQNDIRVWLKQNNTTLIRDNYNESFFQKEKIFLNKN
jgi:hypothetical protein